MLRHRQLLSELLRPQQLGDLTLPRRDIDCLSRMVNSGSIMNMIFYGKPGLGKTSAARVIIGLLEAHSIEINGSSATGIETIRNRIEGFASSMSMWDKPKLCFIDEADFLSKSAQSALRYVIENSSRNCRYLFTANNIGMLSPAIQSRMLMINFDIAPADRLEVLGRLNELYARKLSEWGIHYDERRLREIIGIYYPDLRAIANHIEYEFA